MLLNFVAILGGGLLGGLLVHYKFKQSKKKTNKITYECISHLGDGTMLRGNTKIIKHKDSCNTLQPIIEFIDEAKYSLDFCFYMITEINVIKSIVKAKDRKVKIRLITDLNDGIIPNKNFGLIFKEGIKVYSKEYHNFTSIMHNKFIIRDHNVLLQGSLNLTTTTAFSSFDNVLITNDPALVIPFQGYFEEIVENFEL